MATQKFIGAKLSQAGVFAGVMAEQVPVGVTVAQSKIITAYILPARARSGRDDATWADEIDLLYGPDAKNLEVRHISVRMLRNQEVIARIIMEAVDEHWRPLHFAVITSAKGVHWAYVVPGLPYWRALVERMEGGDGSS